MLLILELQEEPQRENFMSGKEWVGWRPTHMMGTKITGKTLGLIGMEELLRQLHKAHFGF